MLAQQDGPRAVQHGAQRHRDDYRVVQRPRDRDEVGDEIDRDDEVEENQREEELSPPRYPPISEQASKHDYAVGDEARHGDGVGSPPHGNEREDCSGVQDERRERGNDEDLPVRHRARTIAQPRSAQVVRSSPGRLPGLPRLDSDPKSLRVRSAMVGGPCPRRGSSSAPHSAQPAANADTRSPQLGHVWGPA